MQYKLTQYSHGAGCGCKLSPSVLRDILSQTGELPGFNGLLVGHETADDAAVVDLDGKTAIISTTDFFMPVVDDPYDFGAIAATNAISDIYAMGGTPIMAISILGWPIDKIPPHIAAEVVRGGREVCTRAGIPLAGGHSIDSPEPIFGLAVTGKAETANIKRNRDGMPGDLLYLTKPLGVGVVTTAQKKNLVHKADLELARQSMLALNMVGQHLAHLGYVRALTDVTGFGLGGHLLEICDGAGLSATVFMDRLPLFPFVEKYIQLGCIPGGTTRNWDTYGHRIDVAQQEMFKILADPQTSGGLLISIDPSAQESFENFLTSHGIMVNPIGSLGERQHEDKVIFVK